MAGNLIEFQDASFTEDVIQSDVPVLVDFSAVWCGPCKALKPTVTALAEEYAGRIKVGTMDIDQNPKTPTQYHVRAVPTLILFKDGKPADQIMGAVNKRRLISMIDGVL